MNNIFGLITFTDIAACAAIAFIGAVMIKYIPLLLRLKRDQTQFLNHVDLAKVIDKCYALFPLDSLLFNGETFRRGMYLRITTVGEKIIEGRFIGANRENVLCILTDKTISAEIIENISGITVLENE